MNPIHDGVFPTMITPFTRDGALDLPALEQMVPWYIQRGVAGLFAVCQSSEMFLLSLQERVLLAKEVVRLAAGRVQVVVSGHISDDLSDQIEELRAMSQTGADAVVLITNRLARQDQDDSVWQQNACRILEALPGVTFGLYECPAPYKRLMSPQLLAWCAGTGRFAFLKDTSCDVAQMRAKLDAIRDTPLKLFNANSATLLDTLELGAAGFSGVMGNMHPQLYAWLCQNWRREPETARQLQDLLGVASMALSAYPVDAKYYQQLEGLPLTLQTRTRNSADLNSLGKLNMRQLQHLTRQTEAWLAKTEKKPCGE